jgi:hypothetical protein
MVVPLVIGALAMQHAEARAPHLADLVIFAIGLAPNAWGFWNMLYLAIRRHREVSIGLFGAALVLVLGVLRKKID